jgi:hypothetical protein
MGGVVQEVENFKPNLNKQLNVSIDGKVHFSLDRDRFKQIMVNLLAIVFVIQNKVERFRFILTK